MRLQKTKREKSVRRGREKFLNKVKEHLNGEWRDRQEGGDEIR